MDPTRYIHLASERRLSRLQLETVHHVAETAVQPGLVGRGVVLGVDLFGEHMSNVATQPGDLLYDAALRRGHEFAITAVPQLIAISDRAGHTGAVGFDGVVRDDFRPERRQIPMPIDDLSFIAASGGVHLTPSEFMHHTAFTYSRCSAFSAARPALGKEIGELLTDDLRLPEHEVPARF